MEEGTAAIRGRTGNVRLGRGAIGFGAQGKAERRRWFAKTARRGEAERRGRGELARASKAADGLFLSEAGNRRFRSKLRRTAATRLFFIGPGRAGLSLGQPAQTKAQAPAGKQRTRDGRGLRPGAGRYSSPPLQGRGAQVAIAEQGKILYTVFLWGCSNQGHPPD